MSLLINGMDMPKNCKDCPCREYGKFSYESDWCCLNRKNIVNAETISPNCPLSEIPTPHGRLIDADEFFNKAKEYLSNSQNDFYRVSLLQIFKDILNSTETVIEKEDKQ